MVMHHGDLVKALPDHGGAVKALPDHGDGGKALLPNYFVCS